MDPVRLQDIYAQHAAALVLYARQWCTAPDDAVQEALLALSKCHPDPDDPVAWLYTATKRRALNIARGELRRQEHHTRAAQQRSEWFVTAVDTSAAASAELGERVIAGLQQLQGEQRELVVARVWGNLSFEQLGQMHGCAPSTALRRYQAALACLRTSVLADLCPNGNC